MALRRLHDEIDKQEYFCSLLDTSAQDRNDDPPDTEFGADPFDILAQLEEELGCPLYLT
jgi:hypothetical protein